MCYTAANRMSLRVLAYICIAAGLGLAALVMAMAWDHNPAGGIYWDYGTGEVHWARWLGAGASVFVLWGGGPGLLILLYDAWQRRRANSRRAI
jgi:hypothetical protein